MKQKHVPQRTCVSCRSTVAKRTLMRLVRLPDGSVELDPTGKASGRGAYLCENEVCLNDALKRGRLAAALRTTITIENTAALRRHAGIGLVRTGA